MKTIVCFGDTNTWGVDPKTDTRLPFERRWTGILTKELASEYRVLEEGQAGRTIICNDPVEKYKNGMEYLMPCLQSHMPVDLLVVMLGTVQLKSRFHQTAEDIAMGLEYVLRQVQASGTGPRGKSPQILLMSPIAVGDVENTWLSSVFDMPDTRKRQQKFRKLYQDIAGRLDISFMAAEDYARTSEDGIHIAEESHRPFAMAVAEKRAPFWQTERCSVRFLPAKDYDDKDRHFAVSSQRQGSHRQGNIWNYGGSKQERTEEGRM